MKQCKTCNKRKQNKSYYVSYIRKGRKTYSVECKSCSIIRAVTYRRKHKDRGYSANIKHLYGITELDYNKMLKKQKGKCSICRSEKSSKNKKRFDIDHDHETGKVRGLLCHSCNLGIGAFKDSVKILNKAIKYLGINYGT